MTKHAYFRLKTSINGSFVKIQIINHLQVTEKVWQILC